MNAYTYTIFIMKPLYVCRLWNNYDINGNGFLDRAELSLLVKDILKNMAKQQHVMTQYVQSLFASDESTYQCRGNSLAYMYMHTYIHTQYCSVCLFLSFICVYIHTYIRAEDDDDYEEEINELFQELSVNADSLAQEIQGRLDVNKDGKISKEEFVTNFGVVLQTKLDRFLRATYS